MKAKFLSVDALYVQGSE